MRTIFNTAEENRIEGSPGKRFSKKAKSLAGSVLTQ